MLKPLSPFKLERRNIINTGNSKTLATSKIFVWETHFSKNITIKCGITVAYNREISTEDATIATLN